MLFKVALVQKKAVPANTVHNLKIGLECVAEAAEMGADIVLFPELWLTGYAFPFTFQPPEAFISAFAQAAKQYGVGVVITLLSAGRENPRNSAFVISKTGEVLLRYDKVHTCDFGDESVLESGDGFYVCDFCGVKIGVMICYDREFPESARILMLKGAELILVPNACDINYARLNQLSCRAFENMTAVAMANYPAAGWGSSCAFSPVIFGKNGESKDNTLFTASDSEEGLFIVDFDMKAIRAYRKSETWGNAYRKVNTYEQLLDPVVQEPFIRKQHFSQK